MNERIKKYLRRIMILGLLVAGFAGIVWCFNQLLVTPDTWSDFVMEHFYNREENIENLYLGSSHVYCDVDPDILDELTQKNNFNLSTSSQSFYLSYLLLQEADKLYDLEHVYLEMYYYLHIKGNENYYETASNFIVWDRMKNSAMKYISILQQDPNEELLAVYLPFSRFNSYLFDTGHIKNVQYRKEEIDKRHHNHESGYRESLYSIDAKQYKEYKNGDMDLEPMSVEAKQYLLKIIEYCADRDISLTLFSSPMPEWMMIKAGDYDYYVDQVRSIADEYGLQYYDFNLCKEQYLSLSYEHFRDDDHLNGEGADVFTPVLHDVLTNDKQEYFYDSYQEKLEKTEPAMYGLITDQTVEIPESGEITYEIASNREEGMEYRVEFIPSLREKECEVIQDYAQNKRFSFYSEEEGVFQISARMCGETEPFVQLQVEK